MLCFADGRKYSFFFFLHITLFLLIVYEMGWIVTVTGGKSAGILYSSMLTVTLLEYYLRVCVCVCVTWIGQ